MSRPTWLWRRPDRRLSPCLMIRVDLAANVTVQIADGDHRVCASFYTDENTDAKIVEQ